MHIVWLTTASVTATISERKKSGDSLCIAIGNHALCINHIVATEKCNLPFSWSLISSMLSPLPCIFPGLPWESLFFLFLFTAEFLLLIDKSPFPVSSSSVSWSVSSSSTSVSCNTAFFLLANAFICLLFLFLCKRIIDNIFSLIFSGRSFTVTLSNIDKSNLNVTDVLWSLSSSTVPLVSMLMLTRAKLLYRSSSKPSALESRLMYSVSVIFSSARKASNASIFVPESMTARLNSSRTTSSDVR